MHFLNKYFFHQSFQPSLLGIFINPFYFIRRLLFIHIKKKSTQLSGKLLDFGCGRKPYQNLFDVSEYIGVDIKGSGHDHKLSKVDVFYDGITLPFESEQFNAVFSSEVIEHLSNPEQIIPELCRVMKPGGRLLLTAPFCWNEHEMPFDFNRYTSVGIQQLLQKHGFKILSQEKSGNFARVCFQLAALYVFELTKKWGKLGFVVAMLFIIPVNIIGVLLIPLLPVNQSLYFNHIILAEKYNILSNK